MAYDEDLAARIRDHLTAVGVPAEERRMFGGLAFMIRGHMTVTASGRDGIMVKADPDDRELHAAGESVVMGGRRMRGWVRIPPDRVTHPDELAKWIDQALRIVETLPPK